MRRPALSVIFTPTAAGPNKKATSRHILLFLLDVYFLARYML
jgi:hypothetical protein